MASPSTPTVRIAAESERRAALELALRPLQPEARGPLLDAVAGGTSHPLGPLDALIVAVRGDAVAAATWAQPSPGNAAALWLPEWTGRRPPGATPVERSLVELAVAACDNAGVSLTQTLFEHPGDERIAAVEGAGFRPIATLHYLGRSVRPTDTVPKEAPSLAFEPYSPRDHNRLKRLLLQTYIDSLDCPGLENFRDLDDTLKGYQATGRYDPAYWLFARADDEDVGVLLLAEHPDADQTELIYMGLTPAARGRGYGARIVAEAISATQRIGSDQLMVAVDAANTPARRLYDRAGFATWARRYVYIRSRGAEGKP